jgi:hypothetical protein
MSTSQNDASQKHDRSPESQTAPKGAHDLLEAFNAEGIVDHPEDPGKHEPSPAADADAPAPPG